MLQVFCTSLLMALAGQATSAGALAGVQVGVAAGETPAPRGATSEEIARAIEELGATQFEDRQAATELLFRAGEGAKPALQEAAKSTDPEIRARATALLNKLRLGIRPETPPEVLALIDQFRYAAAADQRRQALVDLQAKGHWQTVLTLIRGHQNPQEQRNLATAIAGEAGKIVSSLVDKGDLAQAEEVLELVATSEAGVPQLTAFLLLTDRLDTHIAAAREKASEQPKDEHWTRLAYLLRAKGDLSGAIEAASHTSDLVLRTNLLAEARRWDAAADFAESLYRRNPGRLESAAFAATYFRLAGKEAELQRVLDALLKAANVDRFKESDPRPADPFVTNTNIAMSNLVTAAKTLLLNERIEDGLQIMRKLNPLFAHTIYLRQHRHAEALDYVGVTAEKKLDRAWLEKLPTQPPWLQLHPDYRFAMAAQVARQLRQLGRNEQVDQVCQTLRELDAPEADRGRRLSMMGQLTWQLGRYDEAIGLAAEAIAAGVPPAAILTSFVGREEGPHALAWYERLLAENPQADRQKTIATAVWLVIPNPRRGKPPDNWRELVAAARLSVQALPPPAKAERLVAFGHTCKTRGDLEFARQLFLEAAQANPATSTHIGDLAAADGDWAGAGRHYAAAFKANPADRRAAFLLGHVLSKAGDSQAGARQLRLANLTVLAPEARLELASSFRDTNLKEETVRQLEIVCRTALPDSVQATSAAERIGNVVTANEPRHSAHCWEQSLLHVLNATAPFNEPQVFVSHEIHKALARAALAEGKAETVAAELARCEKIMPADVGTTAELAPALRRGGMEELADGLLERGLAKHREVLEAFPNSAMYLNNAAWICARAQRKLDESLELAQKAVELAPDEAAYQDTLAEVHFQRGDREAAVAAARKCLAIAPDNKLFATRLKHFQEDELKTLDGTEGE